MVVLLAIMLVVLPCAASGKDLQAGDEFPNFAMQEGLSGDDYTYLGLSRGLLGRGKTQLNDVKAELVILQFLNKYCVLCQKEAPEFRKLHEELEKDPAFKAKIKILGVAIGNTPKELEGFKKEYGIRFPLAADEETTMYRQAGSPRGSPIVYILKKKDGKWFIVDGFKGETTTQAMLDRARIGIGMNVAEVPKKPLWSEEPVRKVTREEVVKLLGDPKAVTVTKTVPFDNGDLFVIRKGKETLFVKSEGRKAICSVCHDTVFVYVFDREGVVRDFIPVDVTKYMNDPFTPEELKKLKQRLVGRNILAPFKFDKDVDAVTSATLTSILIYDSVHHGKELMEVVRKEKL